MKIIFFLLMSSMSLVAQDGFPVRIEVANGTLEGVYNVRTNVQQYFGIPFAAPPVGENRWRAPQPATDWDGVRQATDFGPRAIQPHVWDDMRFRSAGVSEDCLYLNVWTPAKTGQTGLPVLLYFYGGGNAAGDGSEYRYDGTAIAKEGVVVVTANYRLNIFGFLAHPALSAEAEYGSSGNYGSLDQAAAIDWVRENIAAFGGDPDRITIGGESAGSMAVSMHMTSPLSRDDIAGAIGQSGGAIGNLAPQTRAEAEAHGKIVMDQLGATTVAEMRALPTRQLYEVLLDGRLFSFDPHVDGYFLTERPEQTLAAGDQAKIPLLVGWTSAEAPATDVTAEAFADRVRRDFPDQAARLLQRYTPATDGEAIQALTEINSDRWMGAATYRWFDLHRRTSGQPGYRYLFDQVRPQSAHLPGAPHASDIEYALGNLDTNPDNEWTEEDREVSKDMVKAFANFVKRGRPDSVERWPAAGADGAAPLVMIFGKNGGLRRAASDERFEIWE